MWRRVSKHDFLEELAEAATISKKSGIELLFVKNLANLQNVDSSLIINKFTKYSFLQTLSKTAAVFRKRGAERLFTELVKSIPNADNSVNYKSTKTGKQKTRRTKTRNETIQTKDFNTNNDALKRQESSSSRKKGKVKKNRNASNSKTQKCILCKTKSGNINQHYHVKHKIDFAVWLNRLSENRRNGYNNTTCLQCNIDYKDNPGLNKHMIEYHNINAKMDLRKRLVKAQKSNHVKNKIVKKKTVSNAISETIEREHNAIEQVVDNQVRQNERPMSVDFSKIERFCGQCDNYVKIPLFESHTAAHQEERQEEESKGSEMQVNEQSEVTQNNFRAPYEQLNSCAEPTTNRQPFVDIPSDGNCFFFSIIKLMNLSTTPLEIRRQLLASPFVSSCSLNPDGARSILSSETEYAESDCINIFCKVYDKNVCIHYHYVNSGTKREEIQYCQFKVNASQSFLHLHLQNEHYTPLIEM